MTDATDALFDVPAQQAPPAVDAATLLAVDPGNRESAYTIIDTTTRRPLHFAKIPNGHLLNILDDYHTGPVVIEMIASYGMAVGADVFDTCVWIGRFYEAASRATRRGVSLMPRRSVKLHHCGSARAKDTNITQALVDRFAAGQPNKGKGTKANPGWFHGFAKDVWQAYALAVYVADLRAGRTS